MAPLSWPVRAAAPCAEHRELQECELPPGTPRVQSQSQAHLRVLGTWLTPARPAQSWCRAGTASTPCICCWDQSLGLQWGQTQPERSPRRVQGTRAHTMAMLQPRTARGSHATGLLHAHCALPHLHPLPTSLLPVGAGTPNGAQGMIGGSAGGGSGGRRGFKWLLGTAGNAGSQHKHPAQGVLQSGASGWLPF